MQRESRRQRGLKISGEQLESERRREHMVSRTNRPHPCGMEPLEGRFMMDSAWGHLVSGFVRAPVGDLYHRGAVIAYEGQEIYNHHPPHEPPPPVVDHGLDALTP